MWCVCVCVRAGVRAYVCMLCMRAYECMRVCVRTYMRVCVRMYVCAGECTCLCLHVRV